MLTDFIEIEATTNCLAIILPKMLHTVFVLVHCLAENTFFKGGSENGVDVILP